MSENELAEAIGKRIADLRDRRGLTQTQLAERAGVSIHTLRNWEQGHREPMAGAVIALAGALGVSADELLGMGKPATEATTPPPEPTAQVKPARPKKVEPEADVKPEVKKKGKRKEG